MNKEPLHTHAIALFSRASSIGGLYYRIIIRNELDSQSIYYFVSNFGFMEMMSFFGNRIWFE